MAYTSSKGINGLKYDTIAGDWAVVVGVDENINVPAVARDENGAEVKKTITTSSGGQTEIYSSMPKYRQVDTSNHHLTGNIILHAGNKASISSANGGIELDTTGVVTINSGGGMIVLNSTGTVDMTSGTFQMTSTEGMRLSSDDIHMDCKNTNLSGNLALSKNLRLSGGLAVQGELFTTHITAQAQPMVTENAGKSTGYLNPAQSYAVLQGNSELSKAFNGEILPFGGEASATPLPGYIPVNLIFDIPGIPGLSLPLPFKFAAQLQFPKGVHLISNMAVNSDPASCAMIIAASMAGKTLSVPDMPDFNGPAHSHQYVIPACTLLESTDAVWEASAICDKDEAAEAKPMQMYGMGPQEFIEKATKKAAKEEFETKTALGRWIKEITS